MPNRPPNFDVEPVELWIAGTLGLAPGGWASSDARAVVNAALDRCIVEATRRRVGLAALEYGAAAMAMQITDRDLADAVRAALASGTDEDLLRLCEFKVRRDVRLSLGLPPVAGAGDAVPASVRFHYERNLDGNTEENVEDACRAVDAFIDLKAADAARTIAGPGLRRNFLRRALGLVRSLLNHTRSHS